MSHAISGSQAKDMFSSMETMSKDGVSSGDQKKLLKEARDQGVNPEQIGTDLSSGKTVSQLENGKI